MSDADRLAARLQRWREDDSGAAALELWLDAVYGADRTSRGNGMYREPPRELAPLEVVVFDECLCAVLATRSGADE